MHGCSNTPRSSPPLCWFCQTKDLSASFRHAARHCIPAWLLFSLTSCLLELFHCLWINDLSHFEKRKKERNRCSFFHTGIKSAIHLYIDCIVTWGTLVRRCENRFSGEITVICSLRLNVVGCTPLFWIHHLLCRWCCLCWADLHCSVDQPVVPICIWKQTCTTNT